MLAVKVGGKPEITAADVGQHLKQHVEGQQVEVSDEVLGELVDLSRLRKIYKLNSLPKKGAAKTVTSDVDERKELETSILGAMALKGS